MPFLASATQLYTYFSQSGLHGEIHFTNSKTNQKLVTIKTYLETTLQYPDQIWSWAVHEYPIDYSIIDPEKRCDPENVGNQIHSFDENLGFLTLPGNESSVWNDLELNLTGKRRIALISLNTHDILDNFSNFL